MSGHFADRLMQAVQEKQSQVLVGLDPRFERLPAEIRERQVHEHGRTPRAAARAYEEFNREIIEQVADVAVAVKPQVAFYEQMGVEGMAAYARTVAAARSHGLLVIGDVKRNDISSTAGAYASGHLAPEEGRLASEDFAADAITINPYLGGDGVVPFMEAGARCGGGAFALVKTSNPSSVDIQDVTADGGTVYEVVARLVDRWGADYLGESGYSALGAVVGATYPQELERLRSLMPRTPLLVPGFGAQGGGVQDVLGAFDKDGLGAIVNSSRGIIFAWTREPYDRDFGPDRWREAVAQAARQMRRRLWDATH
jgi:orotidine-5'-phosphate decarboxylase